MYLRLIAEGSTRRQRANRRWGVSFLVADVLFDAFGRADVFWKNIRHFKIRLSRVRRIVISHDDWDHTAGLEELLRKRPKTRVYLCRNAKSELKELVRKNGGIPIEISGAQKIAGRIFSLGQMRADAGRGILYEQSIAVKSKKGYWVLTGCAHPGILRIVKRAVRLFGRPPQAVCGGFHMKDNRPTENERIVRKLTALGVRKVVPLHCTGRQACRTFDRLYGPARIKIREGNSLKL